ncbi:hypothetical protein N7539_005285 [Penicillium diatomitis]|uniref:Uncharacterized protein n=1 Tax=Penicillium diatomitis TaxID=2819901 RepID=A0A9X0BUU7_9EURO|nr:uncharacterized protein N7539_005285 [Penicillium diatomitis]KAJ5485297.1 hypothetical protein N7539_005285 [Penicillium diatomitis]
MEQSSCYRRIAHQAKKLFYGDTLDFQRFDRKITTDMDNPVQSANFIQGLQRTPQVLHAGPTNLKPGFLAASSPTPDQWQGTATMKTRPLVQIQSIRVQSGLDQNQ